MSWAHQVTLVKDPTRCAIVRQWQVRSGCQHIEHRRKILLTTFLSRSITIKQAFLWVSDIENLLKIMSENVHVAKLEQYIHAYGMTDVVDVGWSVTKDRRTRGGSTGSKGQQ